MAEAEELSSDDSDRESRESESDLSLSCAFSSFEGDSSDAEATGGDVVEPYQYEPVDSHSSSGSESAGDTSTTGDKRLLSTEWYVDYSMLLYFKHKNHSNIQF